MRRGLDREREKKNMMAQKKEEERLDGKSENNSDLRKESVRTGKKRESAREVKRERKKF